MMGASMLTPAIVSIGYVCCLFVMAALAQMVRQRLGRSPFRVHAYGLALAVYCTSWTFYGAVGTAVATGWNYLPIYLGPIALFAFAPRFLRSLVASVHEDGATSLSDFIGSRFGKSQGVAALVTIIALFGTIPYLALQLRSVGTSFSLISGQQDAIVPIILAAVGLAMFAILFGTRQYEVAARNEAILFAVATESLLKLLALCAVAVFAAYVFFDSPPEVQTVGLARFESNFAPDRLTLDFPVQFLLSMLAIICLPRQFYVGVMEARQPDDIVHARWPLVIYLIITVIAVPPIAVAGLAILSPDTPPDFFVLSLPMAAGADGLAWIVFLGGLSAATAMVVTETVALSTMVSNDLVVPFVLRSAIADDPNFGQRLLWVRRGAILLLMVAGVGYAMYIPAEAQLASVGLIAFVALAQTAPALLMSVYRAGNDALAAMAGMATGFALWLYTLFLPSIGGIPRWAHGALFDPLALMGESGFSPIVHGAIWSLCGNMLAHALVAARRVETPGLHLRFMRPKGIAQVANIGELGEMVSRFVGAEGVSELLATAPAPDASIDRATARRAERLIASVVGASSARAIMASALSGASLNIGDVASMLDASAQSLRFSRGLLAATLENIDPGVSVVDRNLRLVAWNSRYLDMFNYPPNMVRVGASVADLIRFNAERGECGPGEVESHVARRLGHMRHGQVHSFERVRPDGRVIKTVGGPMPDGGYVMCFTDITAEANARNALVSARAELEHRVIERTAELSDTNAKLALAMADKTRFLAAASHDLLQPLHAARLFAASLRRDMPETARETLGRVDRSIAAADELLRTLLDISKLDAGGIVPAPTIFSVRAMLEELMESFAPLASEKGLQFRLGAGDAQLFCDRTLLRSIIQNFLSNAVRYTQSGGILLGVRRSGGMARIEVHDTGPGIAKDKQAIIFREFERLDNGSDTGVGLGLAIVERSAMVIGAQVSVRSHLGRGSRFAVSLPICAEKAPPAPQPAESVGKRSERPQTILVVDDDRTICAAMAALLRSLGHGVDTAHSPETAQSALAGHDAALVDCNMGQGADGIALIAQLRTKRPSLRCALVTADRSADTMRRAEAIGVPLLPKPLSAEQLEDWLSQVNA
jgi:Na+/proline symporter/CheY-like chemotaxis protein/PAS domain-containing protein